MIIFFVQHEKTLYLIFDSDDTGNQTQTWSEQCVSNSRLREALWPKLGW